MEANAMEIADALTEIRDLQDESGRSAFVHAIGEVLGRPLLVQSHTSPKLFLYNVVVECRAREGGVDALLAAVDFLAGSTHAAALVRRLVSPAENLLETTTELQIKELLQGLSVPALARIYHAVTGDTAVPVPGQFGDAWQAFSVLLDVNTGPDGLPPHLLFIALLIRALERDAASHTPRADAPLLSARLHEWMTGQLAELRALAGEGVVDRLEQVRSERELQLVGTDLPIYLIIQLEPVSDVAPDTADIRISHWRQIHPFEWRPVRGEDQVVPRDQVPQRVSELVQEAEGGWAYQLDDSLVLEFVLPYSLLHLAPDEWTRDPPGEPYPTPLGTEYEVIIRSHERIYTRTWHRAWRQRWRVLFEEVECLVHWPETGRQTEPEEFRDRLLDQDNLVVCVLSSPPDREPGKTQLRMALRTGVPIVLWNRGGMSVEELREALSSVIERPGILDLPTEIKQLRRGRSNSSGSRRPAVTLVFDNPDHFLDEEKPLRPPG